MKDHKSPTRPRLAIYLAGPMRGLPNDNREQFDAAADVIRSHGHTVYNPVDHDRSSGVPVGETDGRNLSKQILWDLECIANADLIVVLPGWINSTGVRLELEMARFVGCPVQSYAEFRNSQGDLS